MNDFSPAVEIVANRLAALESVLQDLTSVAVAVSGGVDSLTLASVAQRRLGADAQMFHAVSPAVPAEATQRTRELAAREGWRLTILDAHEFSNEQYLRNPVNRCFHCKTSLYEAIRPATDATIVAGTNLDDLGEYRPGLLAAAEHGVRHPFVEAEIDKRGVRAIARYLGLDTFAELPASPCLSSRIETGIAIDATMLAQVHASERLVGRELAPKTVRCRVRARGVVIELNEEHLVALSETRKAAIQSEVRALFARAGYDFDVTFAPYRIGSAFLHARRDPIIDGRSS